MISSFAGMVQDLDISYYAETEKRINVSICRILRIPFCINARYSTLTGRSVEASYRAPC